MTTPRVSPPGRPLAVLFLGFPLWWVLGISNFVALGAAVVMLGELLRRRNILVPPGFGWWLAFLAVYGAGGLLLAVDAPGALPEAGNGGVVTWAYRLLWYAAATVLMLYVGNLGQLSRAWFCRVLGWMFVVLVGGGLFAVAFPTFTFSSLLELVLPRSLTSVQFVRYLVHPTLVQLYEGAATDTPRPSAPFAYANTWGVAYACFLPFFLIGWWRDGSPGRRAVAATVLVLSLIPVITSLNRGLWVSLLAGLVFTVVRAALAGRLRAAAALVGAAALAGAVLFTGPAQEMIQTRLDNPTSNAGRIELARLTVQSVGQGSPVVGFGNTRDVASSFYSIAGGDSPDCPRCAPPALGTQGHLWLVVYTQGLLGLVLYIGFFATIAVRGLRSRGPYVTAGLTVLLMHLITSPVYDTVGAPLLAILGAAGLIWRSVEVPVPGAAGEPTRFGPLRTTRDYALLLRRHLALIAVLVLAGAGTGVLWQVSRGVPAVGTVSLELPIEPTFVTEDQGPGTMDNEAQFARSAGVMTAIERAVGHPVTPHDLVITATANSRLLNLRLDGRTAAEARAGVGAAATAIIAQRSGVLHERLAATSTSLVRQSAGLQAAVKTLDEAADVIADADPGGVLGEGSQRFEERRQKVLTRSGVVVSRQARAEVAPLQAGDVVHPARTHTAYGTLRVSLVSGAVLGLIAGGLLARRLDLAGPRLRHRRAIAESRMAVLATVDLRNPAWISGLGPVLLRRPSDCIAVPGPGPAARVAGELEGRLDRPARPGRPRRSDAGPAGSGSGVLLVAQTSTRLRDLVRTRTRLERSGHTVLGLVLVRGPARRWRPGPGPTFPNRRMALS